MTADSIENILIVGPSWVGDMVMAQSLFMRLKQRQPQPRLTVLAPDWTRPLIERMPEVDDSIALPFDHGEIKFAERRAIGKSLREHGFTTAIVLPNSFKSALIPFHAGIPRRIGWRGEWRYLLLSDCRRLDARAYPLMVQRFVALADPPGSPPPTDYPRPRLQTDADRVDAALAQFGLNRERPVLAICPGAEFGEAKQWPARHFASLGEALLAQGWQLWIFGSANDRLAAEAIQADIGDSLLAHCVNLTGRTSLAQAIDLLSLSRVVVSNDSGLMHIASALARPVVALFGSTSPDFTPPLSERVKLLATDIECRPCFQRQCPLGHLRCLNDLSPELAIDAVRELAEAPSS